MTDYVVKLRFWLRAYDSTIVSAATDAEAFHLAKAMARHMMVQTGQPEEIDIEERREGLISYVDRLDDDRRELTDAIPFDGDRPLHPEARRLIRKLAVLGESIDAEQAHTVLLDLIAEARAVPADALVLAPEYRAQSRSWSVDQAFEYRGTPAEFAVTVVDESGAVHALDPRFDLRNHSPSGFAWGYPGSGPAQLALALLAHALHNDERAEELYQEFKDDVIACLDPQRPWRLTTDDILGWVLKHPSTARIVNDD